jgi:putative molybdopterin biosynthesis protein
MNEKILTPQEVADILKIKKNTVYEMIKRGELKATKMGKQLRILEVDVNSYLGVPPENNGAPSPEASTDLNITLTDTASRNYQTQASAFIICGQDMILDTLCNLVNAKHFGAEALRSYMGSYNALYSLYQGSAHIATAHLWDPETDTYNLPYIPKLLPGVDVAVYHLLKRRQGFYVPAGNPKKLHGFGDFRRNDLRFINRERGSGTRILLDCKLQKLQIPTHGIHGYEFEVNSHLASATEVAKGNADFALGNERTALQIPSIEFIPLQEESYEMVIRKEDMNHPIFKEIIRLVQSKDFQDDIMLMSGYDVSHMGTRIL